MGFNSGFKGLKPSIKVYVSIFSYMYHRSIRLCRNKYIWISSRAKTFASWTWYVDGIWNATATGTSTVWISAIQQQPHPFRSKRLKKKVKQTEINKIFKRGTKLFVVGMKAQWDEGGRRILLGNDISDWAVMLRPLKFQCDGVLISAGPAALYVYSSWPHVHSVPTSAKLDCSRVFRDTVTAQFGSVWILKFYYSRYWHFGRCLGGIRLRLQVELWMCSNVFVRKKSVSINKAKYQSRIWSHTIVRIFKVEFINIYFISWFAY